MSPIRKFFLEAVCLGGAVVGIGAAIGGYLGNLPERPERIAIATILADPETTGSITPQAENVPASAGKGAGVDAAHGTRTDDSTKDAWTDPPHRRKPR